MAPNDEASLEAMAAGAESTTVQAVTIALLDGDGNDISTVWRVRRAQIRDQISGDCHARLELENRDQDADVDALMGQALTVVLQRPVGSPVRFSGLVTSAGDDEWQDGLLVVQVHLEPAFQCLREDSDVRRFVDLTRPEILQRLLDPLLMEMKRTWDWKLERAEESGSSPKRHPKVDFVQQRGESTYRFCCRLMAEEGIAFYYDHSGVAETLILVDTNDRFPEMKDATVDLIPLGGNVHDVEAVHVFSLSRSRAPGRYSVRGFDRTRAALPLDHEVASAAVRAGNDDGSGQREIYDALDAFAVHAYEGDKYTATDMEIQAQVRFEALRRDIRVASGQGEVMRFAAGRFFTLDVGTYHQQGLGGRYLLTAVTHTATADAAGDSGYQNAFRCIPDKTPFRPDRIPKPLATGLDLAMVVTPSKDQPIHSEQHGRIRIRFKWDREEGEPAPGDSCWVPVRQGWVGQGFGFQIIPRDGMIVTVEYLGGDVDRPVVTGCLPTNEKVLPYDPEKHTTFGVRTQSLRPDGAGGFFTENYSELAIDDTAKDERFYVRAGWNFQKEVLNDQQVTIRHDEMHTVNHSRAKTIKLNETVSVGGNRFETVEKDQATTILKNEVHQVKEVQQLVVGKGRQKYVGELERIEVGGGSQKKITGSDDLEVSQGNKNATVHGQYNITADEHFKVVHGGEQFFFKDGAYLEATGDIQLKNPGCHVTLGKDGKLSLVAKEEISLQCGSATLSLKSDGTISIAAAKEASFASGASIVKLEPSAVAVQGKRIGSVAETFHEIMGAIVKIN